MISPLDVLKGFITLKSYLTWFLLATTVFGLFCFIKNKFSHNQKTTTLKSYLIYFLIILGLFSFLYLSFFHKSDKSEPSSKYTGQLIGKIDEEIKKYDEMINNYHGLKKDWEKELEKCERELKELHDEKELTQEAKDKIKDVLEKNKTKIKEIKENLDKDTANITILKGKLIQLEQQKEAKEKEMKQKQEEEKLASPDDKTRLKAEIEKLQDEKQKIIEEISEVKLQIGKLENKQEKYQNMLSRAEKFKKRLEEQYKDLTEGEKNLYNKIKSVEDRRAEIQKNIEEVEAEKIKIEVHINQLEVIRQAAENSKSSLDDWDKKHELSFGNFRDALFQGAELYLDHYGGRGLLKALDSGVFKKTASTIAKASLVIHEVHRGIKLFKELFQNEDGTPKMMTKETYDSICARLDRDSAEAKGNLKDLQEKLDNFKNRQNQDNLAQELEQSREKVRGIERKEESVINEYETIIDELKDKQKEVSDTVPLLNKQDKLEDKLENTNEAINTNKEQLKEINPSYARAQKLFEERKRERRDLLYNNLLNKIPNE
ncbi:DNA double-strand break repair Rad50 ATPase [Candidatus Phytoplasma australiense]|uniref:DNA double-strand break repair rad50 ATPase n=1 Tax=Strawberry lethal yellows phytoplasma (CPA) str. NZSb11 TaxID=980422 RepID=R4S1H2_PHYAS|nr:DNA double-strand break repair Rad50 ATPase [Candidatus Phytoplasma australiense]AGL90623.1 DNA double-strand break repair rad50 ATPase [Strawberry lethal yellows phytoplasma (CPA) str. NZSb11]